MKSRSSFLISFMLLAAFSGATIGMAKIITTLYAIQIGANPMQIGIISAMESLGMVILTLPAGFVIARVGARKVYFLASIGPMLLNLAIPLFSGWIWLAIARLLIGLFIPFRIVAMNSAFLQQLRHIGMSKAGWYRGALTVGMGLLGPLLGNWLSVSTSFTVGFVLIGVCFGLMAIYSLGFWSDEAAPAAEADTLVQNGSILSQVKVMLANQEITECCLIEMISSSSGALFGTFILILAMDVAGLSQGQAVSLLMIQGLASVAALLGLGYLVQYTGRNSAYVAGLIAAISALMLLGSTHNYWLLVLGGVLLSVATALVHLVNMAKLSEHSMDKSKISGLFNLAGMIGGFSGAMLGGVIAQLFGLANLFLYWIPVILLTAVICRWHAVRRSAPALPLTHER